ncbi:MAG: AtpZ/AtpI family protein [Candidatus Omnitrophica bacterium]|nr:AtpZ/AtpI family protein [Candidatus Omnitrophota bacterium]
MPKPDRSWIRAWTIASTIPTILIAGVIGGYLLGRWVERRWSVAPWGMVGGLILGLVVGGREAWRLFQQLQPPPGTKDA